MRPVLRQREVAVADLEHVRIVVAPEVDRVEEEAVLVGDGGDAGPVRWSSYLVSFLYPYVCIKKGIWILGSILKEIEC